MTHDARDAEIGGPTAGTKVHIVQGEYHVTDDPNVVVSTTCSAPASPPASAIPSPASAA